MILDIIYEDSDILAIFKPFGVHSQGGPHNKESAVSFVSEYLNTKTVYLLNRLDTPVSGLVLFAKDKRAAKLLNRSISNHSITKNYLAVVFGVPKIKERRLEEQIFFDERKKHAKIKETTKSKEAILEYSFIKKLAIKNDIEEFDYSFSLLSINLITGRKHQIRAQLANIGHPIYFDSKYYRLIPHQNSTLFKSLIKIKNDHIKLMANKIVINNPLNNGKELSISLNEAYINKFLKL